MTEFTGSDGERYAGPIILADCIESAAAMMETSLQGPSGQPLRLLGELILQVSADELGTTRSTIKRMS